MEIQGSVVVVTGASSGIGLATVRSFAQAGAKVVLAARSGETINQVAEELRELGLEALALATDVILFHDEDDMLLRHPVAPIGQSSRTIISFPW